jgi:peroxiredoxin
MGTANLRPGDLAPNLTLPSHNGPTFDLADARGSFLALVFFPLAWTPI